MISMKTSIKSLATVALLSVLALIAGCGGGGAKDPFATTPVPALIVSPGTLNVYSGTPAVVTINSGVGPFQVFSSDSVVLPVTQVVSGAAITLTANSVEAEKAVTLTVRDAYNQATSVSVTVKPSPLLGALTITPRTSSPCGAVATSTLPASICSGETATASILLRGANTLPLPNRQVRFDVLQGPYNFVLDQAGTILAKTATVVTDQNGLAIVTVKADNVIPSQAVLIRATDLTSGNRVDGTFTIIELTNGSAVLSVVPQKYTVKGVYKNECPSSTADYVIYGGTPPYTVTTGLPVFMTLSVPGSSGQTVIVNRSAGIFTASNSAALTCSAYSAPITITDVAGRTITASYDVEPGTQDRPTPPTPDALSISPPSMTILANAGTCTPVSGTRTVRFSVTGGTPAYRVGASQPGFTATLLADGQTLELSWSTLATFPPGSTGFPAGTSVNAIVLDSAGKVVSATLTCQ